MKKIRQRILLGIFLVAVSVLLHYLHFLIFRDAHHILIYLLGDIAFIPLEVFFVSLVFEKIIEGQRKRENRKKVFMVIGLFYMELGNRLLEIFFRADRERELVAKNFNLSSGSGSDEFRNLKVSTGKLKNKIDLERVDLSELYNLLNSRKELMVNLIANPVFTENSIFSDTLLSVFHLQDELRARGVKDLSGEDLSHLKIDAERAYKNLTGDWILYMEHLKGEYPFLYARALTDNPLK